MQGINANVQILHKIGKILDGFHKLSYQVLAIFS